VFRALLNSVFDQLGSYDCFLVLLKVFIPLLYGLIHIGVCSLGVVVLIKSKSNLVDLDLQVLNDVFFRLSSDQEVSRLQLFKVFFDIFKNFLFIGVQYGFFGNGRQEFQNFSMFGNKEFVSFISSGGMGSAQFFFDFFDVFVI